MEMIGKDIIIEIILRGRMRQEGKDPEPEQAGSFSRLLVSFSSPQATPIRLRKEGISREREGTSVILSITKINF